LWGGLQRRLEGLTMLPRTYPQSGRAAEILALLFPGGMEFLRSEFATQSTKMRSILQLIDTDHLADEIDALAGKEFLAAIREIQVRYENMVTERLRRDSATGQSFVETVRSLQSAIVNYAGKIIGSIEHDEEETIERARLALLPIVNFREANRAARASGLVDEPSEPKQPEDPQDPTG